MLSSRQMKLLLSLSVAGSVGTAFYMLSDGGNQDIARTRADEFRVKAATTVEEKLARARKDGLRARDRANELLRHARVEVLGSPATEGAVGELEQDTSRRQGDALANQKPPPLHVEKKQSDALQRGGYTGCHTCSGPRLWFFAEKLGVTRLKRRFTPHPDPNQDP